MKIFSQRLHSYNCSYSLSSLSCGRLTHCDRCNTLAMFIGNYRDERVIHTFNLVVLTMNDNPNLTVLPDKLYQNQLDLTT